MKFVLSIIFLCCFYFSGYTQQVEENTFQQSESATTGTTASAIGAVGGEQINDGGNPPNEEDPLDAPIDGYIQLLAGVALGMMVYHYKRKSNKITA